MKKLTTKVAKPYKNRNRVLRDVGYGNYKEYLNGDEWAAIRESVLARDGRACLACGRPATCVHHTNYKKSTIMGGSIEALVSLCRSCHQFIEFDRDGNKLHIMDVNDRLRFLLRKNGRKWPGRCARCFGNKKASNDFCKKCSSRSDHAKWLADRNVPGQFGND